MAASLRRDRSSRTFWRRYEIPTWLLIAAIYGGWLALTWFATALPWWAVLPLGSWLIAWQMSLQHEVLHGHPTRRQWLNDALGFPPLNLWLPYFSYRDSHLRHHCDANLTDPLEDPESYYLTAVDVERLGVAGRTFSKLCNTFAGRILLAPARGIAVFLAAEAGRLARGEAGAWRLWLGQAAGVAAVLAWVIGICGIGLSDYLVLFVYPGFALALVRSFAEHRAAGPVAQRTAVVERAGPLGLLFLHNNLHVVHHDRPGVPWYELPGLYRAERSAILARNGGLVYRGYGEVMRRYFLTPHHDLVHPAEAVSSSEGSSISLADISVAGLSSARGSSSARLGGVVAAGTKPL